MDDVHHAQDERVHALAPQVTVSQLCRAPETR